MIILLNLISLNNNIAQFDDRAVRRPRGATTARHDRAGWTGKNLILDEALGVHLINQIISNVLDNLFLGTQNPHCVSKHWNFDIPVVC